MKLTRPTHSGLIKQKVRRKNARKKQSYCMKVGKGKCRVRHWRDIEDDHVVISVQHLCWELRKDCLEEMQNWIIFRAGWDLYLLSKCILSFHVVEVPWYLRLLQYQISLLLLLIWQVHEPLPFELFFRKNCFCLASEKKENKWKLSNWLCIAPSVAEWHNVFSDFVQTYVKNGDITSKMLSIRFARKEAFGEVSRVISTLSSLNMYLYLKRLTCLPVYAFPQMMINEYILRKY